MLCHMHQALTILSKAYSLIYTCIYTYTLVFITTSKIAQVLQATPPTTKSRKGLVSNVPSACLHGMHDIEHDKNSVYMLHILCIICNGISHTHLTLAVHHHSLR